jgi:hypothetical protein
MSSPTRRLTPCARRLIDRHFAGRITAGQERTLRQHLSGCPECQDYYERHLLLCQVDPRGLDAKTRLGRGLGLQPAPRSIRVLWLTAAAAAATATVLLAVLSWPLSQNPDGFAVRGGAPDQAQLLVYRVRPGMPAELVQDEISATDELAFAYQNGAGKKWLLVFGTDEHNSVYWYHPGWKDASSNPSAVPLEPSFEPVELPEAIQHSLRGSQLSIHALFADRRLSVRQIEAMLNRPGKLSIPSGIHRVLPLRVRHPGGGR